jgi:hypothetical protein
MSLILPRSAISSIGFQEIVCPFAVYALADGRLLKCRAVITKIEPGLAVDNQLRFHSRIETEILNPAQTLPGPGLPPEFMVKQ